MVTNGSIEREYQQPCCRRWRTGLRWCMSQSQWSTTAQTHRTYKQFFLQSIKWNLGNTRGITRYFMLQVREW